MAKLTIGQKASRVLEFLMGLRNPYVADALRAHGFTDDDRAEGYGLLRRLTDDRLSVVAAAPRDGSALDALDAWENQWFPIAGASLRHRHPAAHEALFRNLTQTTGAEVVISVETLLTRYATLASATDAESRAAIATLAKRGLDAATIAKGRALLDGALASLPEPVTSAVDPAETLAREEALWRWYLEWSEIARAAIREPRLLRELGFLRPGARAASEEETSAAGTPTVN